MKNKRDKRKLNKIVLFIMIAIIIIVVLFNMFITYNKITSVEGINISSSEDTETVDLSDTISDLSDYKATDELTDEDKEDEYQKNYQETTVDDENYLIKTAEWTDKENGEALITINGSLTVEPEETTALYVATLCYSHGLTEDIVVENIQYLVKNYDYVDFIGINTSLEIGIMEVKTFTSDITEDEIRTYLQDARNEFGNYYPHYTLSVPIAIQKYLFGGYGDEYISEDNLQNDPIAIYASCDTMYLNNNSSTDMWGLEYATETYFNFMYENYGDVYFTMSMYSQQDSDPKIIIRYANKSTYNSEVMNAIIGILNPENYGEADNTLSKESLATWVAATTETINLSFTDVKYAADYSYSENFEKAGVKIIVGATIVDVVVGEYEIIEVEAYDSSGNEITVTISGQTVTITDPDYVTGDEITILIYVKLNSSVVTNFDDFLDTNEGTATMSNNFNGESVEVSSPKLVPNTNSYKVQYVNLNTNEEISEEKYASNIAVDTEVQADDEVIDIEGYTYVTSDIETLIVSTNEEENVIILYYAKNAVLYVNYIDEVTGDVLSSYSEDGYEGKSYTTSNIEIDDYVLVSTPENSSGEMEYPTTTVNYYYRILSTVVTRYIDIATEEEIEESVTETYKEGDEYTTEQKEISGYEYVSDTGNTSGIIEREDVEVIYYYVQLVSITITKVSQNDTGTTLEGAEFSLYRLICENSSHTHDTDDDLIDVENVATSCWELIGTYTSGSKGTFTLSDLPITGNYRLVETKAAEDYFLPSGQWKIEFDYGQLDEDETVTVDGVTLKITAINNPPALSLSGNTLYLYNTASFDMPTTGGLGADEISKIGMAIILVGAYWLIFAKIRKYSVVGSQDYSEQIEQTNMKRISKLKRKRKKKKK